MSRKFTWLVTPLLLACLHLAEAQQPTKVYRVGYLAGTPLAAISHRTHVFRQTLRELGYIEGKSIVIEWRGADGNRERQRELAVELVRLNVDVLVASSGGDTRAARQATATIPIVMTQSDDPVRDGFVASLAQPGGNITGLSTVAPETSGKRLEVTQEIVPKLSRVAMIGSSSSPGNAQVVNETKLAAEALSLKIQYIDVLNPRNFETAFQEAVKHQAQAILWLVSGSVAASYRPQIADLGVKNRVPVVYESARYPEAGGLLSYGVNIFELDRRAAMYVDRILKGAKPSDLPVEQPTKFELVINLKAAKQIALVIPPHVLARADRVIR